MFAIRKWAVVGTALILGQQLVACGSQVSANEADKLAGLWNGFHAEVRLVVYDDLNANLNRRKVAYDTNLTVAPDDVKTLISGLKPLASGQRCSPDSTVYVLEITEAGTKRRFSSDNNQCHQSTSYDGYVPTEALAQLAEAMNTQAAL